jgi:DNA-binding transcriptional LysR family regulator
MYIEHLYYFLDVAETLSISKSAHRLFISPQGLSQAIGSLEKEYKISLLNRSKSGLNLTMEGKQFVEHTKQFLQDYEFFLSNINNLNQPPLSDRNTVTFYATAFFLVSGIFHDIFNSLMEAYPRTKFLVLECLPFEIAEKVRHDKEKGANSIGIVNIPEFSMSDLSLPPDVRCEFLLETKMMACVGAQSPYADKKTFLKRDLSLLPLACFNEPLMEQCICHMLKDFGDPNIVLRSSSGAKYSRGIEINQNVVSFSTTITMGISCDDSVIFIPIRDSLKLKIGLMYCPSSYESDPEFAKKLVYLRHHIVETFPEFAIN